MNHPVSGKGADVIVIGAGAIGAACAFFAARAGMKVIVLDRGEIASGTSSACEGNLLVSDKEAGPELDLSLYSLDVWNNELKEFGHLWEFETKGGLVVSATRPSGARVMFCETSRLSVCSQYPWMPLLFSRV